MPESMHSIDHPTIPGPVPPGHHPPHFTEIVCIDVKKVFDSCSNVECESFCFELDEDCAEIYPASPEPVPPFIVVSCTAGTATVGPITILPVPGEPLLRRVIASICGPVTVTFTDATGMTFTINIPQDCICFQKDVLLFMPNPAVMFGHIEVVSFTCLGAKFIKENEDFEICVTIGLRAIVKSEGWVQLLVGSFGYCPVPPTCRELGTLCEGFIAAPFPTIFPPQIFEVLSPTSP
ncbi:MAG TPA: hypothetical protein VGL40_05270 [Bacillota bacterium]